MRARKRTAVISVAVIAAVVLATTLLMRQHRQSDNPPTTPAAAAPPAVITQRPNRAEPPPTSIEPQRRPSGIERERVSPAAAPKAPRALPRTPPPDSKRRGKRVADPGPVAALTPIAPTVAEPLETKKPIEAIAPDTPDAAPVPAPELRADSAADAVFEKESRALAQVLGHYEEAYDRLDANGAAAIWPSVDARALTRAFARLRAQDLDFGDCTFALSANAATARCAGVLHYAQRIGDTSPKRENRVWTIEFARAGNAWRIRHMTAR